MMLTGTGTDQTDRTDDSVRRRIVTFRDWHSATAAGFKLLNTGAALSDCRLEDDSSTEDALIQPTAKA